MSEISRRSVLTASAWAVPVVAIAASTPLVAASTDPMDGYGLSLNGTSIAAGAAAIATVTIPDRAIPIPAGSTTVRFFRLSGTGNWAQIWSTSPGWTSAWAGGSLVVFTPPATPSGNSSEVVITVSAYSRWLVTLDTPHGSLTEQFSVYDME